MRTSYTTVARAATVGTEVKRSRFLCRIESVADEDAARTVVERAPPRAPGRAAPLLGVRGRP